MTRTKVPLPNQQGRHFGQSQDQTDQGSTIKNMQPWNVGTIAQRSWRWIRVSYAQQSHDSTFEKISIYGSLSLLRAYTFTNHFTQTLDQPQSQTSKTTMPRNKGQWHQDRSGGYASLCRSGSQGTVRPSIKSRLAVGCRAESAQQSRPSLK
ncbi:hypothetical protein O0I10_011543 [Lichtheimia ornata]|uniref:Uncharacterized protein n=1 Tax=Lichtheimia ornata TaxID=688661 RepID=A0AAD7XQE1_9FUNG|nr:uncharacterized protein O0I10_011543 [Lichtheimia ornata]KAJ8652804.1 hypothetical protein O0I10_011543 [Lichtheimia ornata]